MLSVIEFIIICVLSFFLINARNKKVESTLNKELLEAQKNKIMKLQSKVEAQKNIIVRLQSDVEALERENDRREYTYKEDSKFNNGLLQSQKNKIMELEASLEAKDEEISIREDHISNHQDEINKLKCLNIQQENQVKDLQENCEEKDEVIRRLVKESILKDQNIEELKSSHAQEIDSIKLLHNTRIQELEKQHNEELAQSNEFIKELLHDVNRPKDEKLEYVEADYLFDDDKVNDTSTSKKGKKLTEKVPIKKPAPKKSETNEYLDVNYLFED